VTSYEELTNAVVNRLAIGHMTIDDRSTKAFMREEISSSVIDTMSLIAGAVRELPKEKFPDPSVDGDDHDWAYDDVVRLKDVLFLLGYRP
jgi:hypothetical protein